MTAANKSKPGGLPPGLDDIALIERHSTRTIVSLAGRYSLADKRNSRGARREFACRTVSLESDSITIEGPFRGALGARVIAYFEEFGRLDGQITGFVPHGFRMSVLLSKERRDKLAAKIDWLDKHTHHELPDDRRHRRIIPRNPHSTLLLSDGTVLGCFIINISASGVAVSADLVPQIGDVLAVGKVIGRVVRLFPEGFALRFIHVQHEDVLEQRLVRT